jgi:hypothetical protein
MREARLPSTGWSLRKNTRSRIQKGSGQPRRSPDNRPKVNITAVSQTAGRKLLFRFLNGERCTFHNQAFLEDRDYGRGIRKNQAFARVVSGLVLEGCVFDAGRFTSRGRLAGTGKGQTPRPFIDSHWPPL